MVSIPDAYLVTPVGKVFYIKDNVALRSLNDVDGTERGMALPHYFAIERKLPSPYINRFLSADTVVLGYTNPQNLNRYSYVRNNPLKYIDPTGHGVDCGIGMGCVSPYTPPTTSTTTTSTNNTNNNSDGNYCATHPGACGGTPTLTLTPAPGGANDYNCFNQPSLCGAGTGSDQNNYEDSGSPLISIAGVLLVVNLGILDTVLAIGIIAAATAGPLGLAAELILIPLELISVDLTIYGGQIAATGSLDHDPLFLIHGFLPNFLPYEN